MIGHGRSTRCRDDCRTASSKSEDVDEGVFPGTLVIVANRFSLRSIQTSYVANATQ